MTDLGLISLNMAATKPNNLIENDFSNQNRSKTSLYLFVNRNIMYFTKKVPTVKGRWANLMCSQRNNPYCDLLRNAYLWRVTYNNMEYGIVYLITNLLFLMAQDMGYEVWNI